MKTNWKYLRNVRCHRAPNCEWTCVCVVKKIHNIYYLYTHICIFIHEYLLILTHVYTKLISCLCMHTANICIPMGKYRYTDEYTNLKVKMFIRHMNIYVYDVLSQIYSYTYCSLVHIYAYMCQFTHHMCMYLSWLTCALGIRGTWNGSGLNLDLCAQTEGLKASRAYPALFPSEFSSILSNTPSERKDLF